MDINELSLKALENMIIYFKFDRHTVSLETQTDIKIDQFEKRSVHITNTGLELDNRQWHTNPIHSRTENSLQFAYMYILAQELCFPADMWWIALTLVIQGWGHIFYQIYQDKIWSEIYYKDFKFL